jgi:hypothetical protein
MRKETGRDAKSLREALRVKNIDSGVESNKTYGAIFEKANTLRVR